MTLKSEIRYWGKQQLLVWVILQPGLLVFHFRTKLNYANEKPIMLSRPILGRIKIDLNIICRAS